MGIIFEFHGKIKTFIRMKFRGFDFWWFLEKTRFLIDFEVEN